VNGFKYLCGYIGGKELVHESVKEKVEKWVEAIHN